MKSRHSLIAKVPSPAWNKLLTKRIPGSQARRVSIQSWPGIHIDPYAEAEKTIQGDQKGQTRLLFITLDATQIMGVTPNAGMTCARGAMTMPRT